MNAKLMGSVLAALVLVLGGCGKKEEPAQSQTLPAPAEAPKSASPPPAAGVAVVTITLGKAVGADKKVAQSSDRFGKKDTIYAAVDTSGAGTATLKARWTYRKGGEEIVVKEDSQTIVPTGPATSEFHISKPDGWPAGDYQVEIFVDDKSAGSKTFSVG